MVHMCLLCRRPTLFFFFREGVGTFFSQYTVEYVSHHSKHRTLSSCIHSQSTMGNGNVLEPQQADCSHFSVTGCFQQVQVKALLSPSCSSGIKWIGVLREPSVLNDILVSVQQRRWGQTHDLAFSAFRLDQVQRNKSPQAVGVNSET